MEERLCFLCDNLAQITHSSRADDVFYISCQTCGTYEISKEAIRLELSRIAQNKMYVFSGLTRAASESGSRLTLLTTNLQDLFDSAPLPDGPLEMIDRILLYVSKKAQTADASVELSAQHYPIAFAKSITEFAFLFKKAAELDYLEKASGGEKQYRLGFKGWERVSELRKMVRESNKAFVAMWFDKKLDSVWKDGFKQALKETGYQPIRIDLVEHNEKICDRIIAEIRRSGLLIADFTGNRGGVYFEAGFAMGLGIQVIWTCRDTDIKQVHFDTRQYNHVVWSNSEDLKKKLINRIEALPLPHPRSSPRDET